MFVIENGDKIQGDASAATVVDYHISGLQGTTLKNLADGQLAATIGDLYTSTGTDVAKTIVLVNTDSSTRTVNLYHTPSGGTARRIIPKDTSLLPGYSLRLEGNMMQVLDTQGAVLVTTTVLASDITVGTLIHEVGGLEADVSAYDGLVKISGGATSAVTAPSGSVVGTSDTQTLTNKTIDGNNNTISNLAHGAEVDNPSSGVHGVTGSVVGTTDTQTLTGKTIDGNSNTISNLAHGAEVDNPSSGVHGVTGSVVGTSDTQTLTNKTIDTASNTITVAASDVASGTLVHERGGLEANISAYDGLVKVSGGATSAAKDPNTEVTTKGDILVRGASTLDRLGVGSDGALLTANSSATYGIEWAAAPSESFVIACSDETTDLAAATGVVTFRMPYAFTITDVRASVTTAPTGATITVDINENGTSILSTKLTIDASEKTSETAATAAVISDSALADDAEITIDIDQVGSTVAGTGLKVYIIGKQA